MEKIAAVVILYHSDEQTLDFIQSYYKFVEKLYVVDNSEQEATISGSLKNLEKVIYLHDGKNKGIAEPLNTTCNLAIKDDFKWLLTMDQDSYFEESDLTNYANCLSSYKEKSKVSMFGVEYIKHFIRSKTCSVVDVEQIITSGSIINLSLFKIVGNFDEALFIDEVDLDYCYKSISKGFKIVQFKNVFLKHSLGQISQHTSFKNLKSTPRTLHPPIRVYYMIRNYLYVNDKYKNLFTDDKQRRKEALLNRIKNNILYGERRFLIIRFIIKAYFDYRNNRMGELKLNSCKQD